MSIITTHTDPIDHSTSGHPPRPARHQNQQPPWFDGTDSTVSSTNTCRQHDRIRYRAPTGYQIDPLTDHLVIDEAESPIVRRIFREYVSRRLGSQAIARALSKEGLRTKTGNHWSGAAIVTVLRNRAYIGEISFRGVDYPAPHAHIIDRALFDEAQEILEARADDATAKHAATGSDYLLSGKIICTICGKHYVGTAARGNLYRYRYYTCWSRIRHGTARCPAERIPADQLDAAILAAMIETYADSALAAEAAEALTDAVTATHSARRDELLTLDAELAKATTAIDRYFAAFESGALSDTTTGQRVERLTLRIRELQERRGELSCLIAEDGPQPSAPTVDDLDQLSNLISEAIKHGDPTTLRRLTGSLVSEIRVTGRHKIEPIFRIPTYSPEAERPAATHTDQDDLRSRTHRRGDGTQVRTLPGLVRPAGIEPATQCLEGTRSIR